MKQIKFLSFFFVLLNITIIYGTDLKKDSLLIKLRKETKYYSKLKKYKKSISLCRRIIRLNVNNKRKLANDYYRLGFYFKKDGKKDSTYKYYLKSKIIYELIGDSIKVAEKLFSIAQIEYNHELYYKSDSSAIEALKYLKGKKNKIVTSLYNCLGINANQEKEYKEAIKWYNSAINSSNDKVKTLRYKNNKANNFIFLNDYEKAIIVYKEIKADNYYNSIPLKLKAKIIDNHAFSKFLNGESINKAEFFKAQKIKELIKDNIGLITNYSYLSDFYKKKRNFSEALKYAYKMYDLSKIIKAPQERIEAIDKIILLEKNSKLRVYAIERGDLKDSIQLAKQQSRNKFVKIIYNYEEEKKQKLEARANLAETTLVAEQQKSQKQLWVFIGLTTFLGFIVYFFYKRNKTKKEKIIEVYKTETRLAKKIHDELANDVYLAMNKIQKENREDTSVLCDLEKIYSLTRNISHENSPVVTGEQFENFLKQLFLEFSIDTCRVMSKGLSEVQVNTLAKEKQIVMYRVLQELLVNMKKHSKANLVVISFSVLKGAIQVRYKDNGIGIDNLSLKNGLQNMETRIKSIGGTIIFESEIQKGFQAKFQLKK